MYLQDLQRLAEQIHQKGGIIHGFTSQPPRYLPETSTSWSIGSINLHSDPYNIFADALAEKGYIDVNISYPQSAEPVGEESKTSDENPESQASSDASEEKASTSLAECGNCDTFGQPVSSKSSIPCPIRGIKNKLKKPKEESSSVVKPRSTRSGNSKFYSVHPAIKKYKYGMAQPAILIIDQEFKVLYRWAIVPSIQNIGGATDRPRPDQIMEFIFLKMAGKEEEAEAAFKSIKNHGFLSVCSIM